MPDCSEIEGSKVLVGQVAVKHYSSFFSGLTDVLAEATHKLDALILPLVKALSTYIYAKEQKKICVALCCMTFLSSLPAESHPRWQLRMFWSSVRGYDWMTSDSGHSIGYMSAIKVTKLTREKSGQCANQH